MIILFFVSAANTFAQCAMCRSTLETNLSGGNARLAASLNAGILYLFAMPYLAVLIIGLLWYRRSKALQQNAGG